MKIVQLFRSLFLLFTFLSVAHTLSYTQNFECGNPELTSTEMQDYLNAASLMAGAGVIGGTNTYKILIHLYVINDNNGNPPETGIDYLTSTYNAIKNANTFFTNGMSFYLCGSTFINNTENFNEKNLTDIYHFLFTEENHEDNSVAVVINAPIDSQGAALPQGSYPSTPNHRLVFMPFSIPEDGNLLAHELGHFFGLLHTFTNPVNGLPALLPDGTCNIAAHPQCCFMPPCNNFNTGDGLSDTSVDPGLTFCSGATVPTPCIVIVDNTTGQTADYYPPYNNLMSYYNSTWNEFSSMQSDLMLYNYETHPNRAYLRDTNEPTCTEYVNPTALANVDRIRYNGSAWTADPLPGASMNIRNNNIPADYNKTTDANGEYQVRSSLGVLSDVDVTIGQLEADNAAGIFSANNGLNTVDALKIRQHLLAVAPLPGPYALIAADVDNNGSLSLVDESLVKKVILGIDLEFANVPSWRFIPRYFLDPQWNFNTAFESNPFTASIQWQDNTTRGYNTTPGYLDDLDITVLSEDLAGAGSWSFYAIKSGDVDFTANISAGGAMAMTLSARESGTSLEVLPHAMIPAGSTFTMVVDARTQKLTAGYQLGMRFDPSVFEIISLNKGEIDNFSLDDFSLQNIGRGEFKAIWVEDKARGINFSNKKSLFKIHCRAKQNIENLGRLIHLDDGILTTSFIDHKGAPTDAEVYIAVIPEDIPLVLRAVYPNPTSSEVSFTFNLAEQGEVAITIQDRTGRTVYHTSSYPTGVHNYNFRDINALANGILNYTVSLGGEVKYTGQIIKF